MNVVSIDPAPSKDGVIFDGEFHTIPASKLVTFCSSLSEDPETLLCWDAPLTGPESSMGSFSQRTIEQFFSRQETGFKTPKGISVLPYSGCPHWAITRACLGLPICGEYSVEKDKLPFSLTTDVSQIESAQPQVVETHPAVAMWLWHRIYGSGSEKGSKRSWKYKSNGSSRVLQDLWDSLTDILAAHGNSAVRDVIERTDTPRDDDHLDAFIGWALGTLLAAGDESVGILGDSKTGALALPVSSDLKTQFEAFAR